MIYDPLFLTIAALLVLMTGVSKAGFAAGVEMSVVPIMAIFIAPQLAAAILLPILLAIDAANIWRYRHHWNRSLIFAFIPAIIVGIGIGALTFRYLNTDYLRLGLGILALAFVAQRLLAVWLFRSDIPTKKPGRMFTFVFGAMAGFTSFVAHAGGPPAKIVLLRHGLVKQAFVGTSSYLFAFINVLKLFPYLMLGQISMESLTGSLLLAPFIPIGVLLGFWLNGVVSEKVFTGIILVALSGAGFKLLWDGMSALV